MDENLLEAVKKRATLPLWPETGRLLGKGRNVTYAAARAGQIPVIPIGKRRGGVPTSWIRRVLGIEQAA